MSDRMPEDMPDKVPECLPDRMPEDLPDNMPEDMPDRMPEDMPEHMLEDMPGRMPDRMPEDMSDRMPEDLPVTKCINVMVGISRSKVILLKSSFSVEACVISLDPVRSIKHVSRLSFSIRWQLSGSGETSPTCDLCAVGVDST